MTTVSSASGGARMRRHENANRPCRDALPQRVRWSRIVTAAGRHAERRGMPADLAFDRGAGPRLEPRARGRPIDRRSAAGGMPTTISSSSAPPIRSTDDRRSSGPRRARARSRWRSPRNRIVGAVAQAAARRELGPVAGLVREVAA